MNDIDVILADAPGLGRVRLCECNSIHMTIGPVTLNLEPQAFAQAALLIRKAMEQLDEVLVAQAEGRTPVNAMDAGRSRFTH